MSSDNRVVREFLPDERTPSAFVSLIFHPLLTPAPAGVFILYLGGSSLQAAVGWITLCALVTVFPLAVYIAVMKVVWDQETSIRENRYQLYALGVALTVTLSALLYYLDAPTLLLASICAGALSGAVGAVANLVIKVSLHTGVSTGISVVLFSLDPRIGLLAGGLTVIIAGARYKMEYHTVSELAVAASIPLGCVTLVFLLLSVPAS